MEKTKIYVVTVTDSFMVFETLIAFYYDKQEAEYQYYLKKEEQRNRSHESYFTYHFYTIKEVSAGDIVNKESKSFRKFIKEQKEKLIKDLKEKLEEKNACKEKDTKEIEKLQEELKKYD
jgi:hypothetical protein